MATQLEMLRLCEPGAGDCLLISAPRGMGKTVLLNWLAQQVKAVRGGRLVRTSADQIEDFPGAGGTDRAGVAYFHLGHQIR